jgi:hypothetical protein
MSCKIIPKYGLLDPNVKFFFFSQWEPIHKQFFDEQWRYLVNPWLICATMGKDFEIPKLSDTINIILSFKCQRLCKKIK